MTIVYTDIVGDLFHFGHVEFLEKARKLGTRLLVGVLSDTEAEKYKRRPILTMEERIRSVRNCRYVDEVIPDPPLVITDEFIKEHGIDIVCHGDDFSSEEMRNFYGVPITQGIFQSIPYTAGISTTDIISRIRSRL